MQEDYTSSLRNVRNALPAIWGVPHLWFLYHWCDSPFFDGRVCSIYF